MSTSSTGNSHHRTARNVRLMEFGGKVTVELWDGEGVKIEISQPQFAGSVMSELRGDTVVVRTASSSQTSSITHQGAKGSNFVLNIGPGTVVGATRHRCDGAVAEEHVSIGHGVTTSDGNLELKVFVPRGAEVRILDVAGNVTVKGDIDGKLKVENLRDIRVSALGRLREVFVQPSAPLMLILQGGVTEKITIDAPSDEIGSIVRNAETAKVDVTLGGESNFFFHGTVTDRFKLVAKGSSTIDIERFTGNPANATYDKEPRATIKVSGTSL